jgi:hypothetical protein
MPSNIHELIHAEERVDLEHKSSEKLNHSKDIARQIVALANSKGGTLLFGVTDNREVEGAQIDEDQEVQRINNIARDSCSPVVNVQCELHELDDGDVLQVDVDSRGDIPCARVVSENGKIKYREYRVRSESSIRYVSDTELREMFATRPSELSSSVEWWFIWSHEDSALADIELPRANRYNTTPITQIINKAVSEGDRPLTRYINELFPFLFVNSLNLLNGGSWVWNSDGITEAIEFDISYPKSYIRPEDIVIRNFGERALSNVYTSKEIMELLSIHKFAVPPGTDVVIDYPGPLGPPKIQIKNPDLFDFEIIYLRRMHGPGIPESHPASLGISNTAPFEYSRGEIEFNASLNIPPTEEVDVTIGRKYAKNMKNILTYFWSIEEVLNDLESPTLLRIEAKIDSLLESLD